VASDDRVFLSGYKRPRRMSLTDALPRNPSGEVLKTDLRSAYSTGNLVPWPAV
jgi:fatty-acyl-CoA synthase